MRNGKQRTGLGTMVAFRFLIMHNVQDAEGMQTEIVNLSLSNLQVPFQTMTQSRVSFDSFIGSVHGVEGPI